MTKLKGWRWFWRGLWRRCHRCHARMGRRNVCPKCGVRTLHIMEPLL